MFYNPFAGFRDPNDPFGLMQQAAASAVPEIAPRPVATTRYGLTATLPPDAPSPSLGFPPRRRRRCGRMRLPTRARQNG